MRRRLLVGARVGGPFALLVALLFALAAVAGCAGPGATPFTLSYPAATAGADPVPISLVDQTGLVAAMTFATADLASPGVEAASSKATETSAAFIGSREACFGAGRPCFPRTTSSKRIAPPEQKATVRPGNEKYGPVRGDVNRDCPW